VTSDSRAANELLLTAHSQAHAASVHSSSSQESHYCSDILDELKENISPLRPRPTGTVDLQNVVTKTVVDCEKVGSHLLIVEDMGTPLRRTTFVKDDERCSPKCVTRTPERRIVSIDGFQSNSSSPQAVPDSYATPLRRTTFVKKSPKLNPECGRGGHMDRSVLVGKLSRDSERNVTESAEMVVKSHVHLVTGDLPEAIGKTCRQQPKSDDPLRDVSQSPLILEDRLLHLTDRQYPERPIRSTASSQCSPSESEYHTAITTPYDESLSENEDADEFLDSNICSETIIGDMSLCRQHLSLKASSDVDFVNSDDTVMENNDTRDLNKEPRSNGPCVDRRQDDILLTSKEYEYEVHTEVISEVLRSDMSEMIPSSRAEQVNANCTHTAADLNMAVCELEVADFDHAGNEQQFFHSARSSVQADDVQYNANILASDASDDHFSATGYVSYQRLSSTPVLNCEDVMRTGTTDHASVPVVDTKLTQTVTSGIEVAFHEETLARPRASEKVHGLFHIPSDDMSYSFNSQTFTKVCATPSFTACVSEDADSYNRTYTKSANSKSVVNLSGSRPASRPLFTDRMPGINCTEDESAGVVPLHAIQSAFHDTAVAQPETYRPDHLPKPERANGKELVQLSRIWSDGETSVVGRDVFSHVGGQTWHMISPGQKRQSLIARLHGDGHVTESAADVINAGHGKREHLDGDGSPVRKRPLIAALKPCEYYFLMLH